MATKRNEPKTVNKTIYFNLAVEEDKELLEFVDKFSIRNFSGFMKTILRDFMNKHNEGEPIPSTFFVSNNSIKESEEQELNIEEPGEQEFKIESGNNGKTITIKISID